MKFKKILLITLLLLTVFTISAVSAADNLTDEEILQDTPSEELELSDDDIISSSGNILTDDGTFTALQNKIYNAAPGSTIVLENDYTCDEGFNDDGIRIAKSLTIDGNGHIINGNHQNRIFQCYYGDIVLKNINFSNGKHIKGGAIYSETSLKIINSNFIDNYAPKQGMYVASGAGGSGGAIFSIGNIELYNCTFERNIVASGGTGGSGAAIVSKADAVINNCIFRNNDAGSIAQFSGEGVIYNSGKLIINYCEFTNNDPSGKFGAVYNYDSGTCKINNCIFDGVLSGSSSSTTKITKTTPKLTAKKATFKVKTKIKKYTATLKTNKNKVMKKITLYLKVNGKTYTAKTNNNGKATFNIKNLKKKGTYKTTITFKGNKNYNKVTKSVKITVK